LGVRVGVVWLVKWRAEGYGLAGRGRGGAQKDAGIERCIGSPLGGDALCVAAEGANIEKKEVSVSLATHNASAPPNGGRKQNSSQTMGAAGSANPLLDFRVADRSGGTG